LLLLKKRLQKIEQNVGKEERIWQIVNSGIDPPGFVKVFINDIIGIYVAFTKHLIFLSSHFNK